VQKTDITFKEITPPIGLWCDSGHKAPEEFQHKPIRFFSISGKVTGVFCECCVIVANYVSDQKRKLNGI
jgi:hypothetical protein